VDANVLYETFDENGLAFVATITKQKCDRPILTFAMRPYVLKTSYANKRKRDEL
jgi:hypothetical protein